MSRWIININLTFIKYIYIYIYMGYAKLCYGATMTHNDPKLVNVLQWHKLKY